MLLHNTGLRPHSPNGNQKEIEKEKWNIGSYLTNGNRHKRALFRTCSPCSLICGSGSESVISCSPCSPFFPTLLKLCHWFKNIPWEINFKIITAVSKACMTWYNSSNVFELKKKTPVNTCRVIIMPLYFYNHINSTIFSILLLTTVEINILSY